VIQTKRKGGLKGRRKGGAHKKPVTGEFFKKKLRRRKRKKKKKAWGGRGDPRPREGETARLLTKVRLVWGKKNAFEEKKRK